MSEYHGYWFWDLSDDKTIQAQDLVDEYCLLNCPQEYIGPFSTRFEVWKYQETHPHASEEFHQMLKEMEEFYHGKCH